MCKEKLHKIICYVSFPISLIALLLSFLRVDVVISYEAFIGWMIALIGIIVGLGSLWQIYNYHNFETKLESRIQKIISEKEADIQQQIVQKEIALYKTNLRMHILNKDWDNSFFLVKRMISCVSTLQSKKEAEILMKLIWLIFEQMDSNNHQSDIRDLFKHVITIGNLLNDADKERLNNLFKS